MTNQAYGRALQDLFARTTLGIKLGLHNTRQLLNALGNPEKSMQHVVVAGTNGKGSTASLLAKSLHTAGISTGLYTSPHLLRYTERMQINGAEISQNQVVALYNLIKRVESQCENRPTFFEATTAMALQSFHEANVQVAVLEVGLGGRLDSTNVVDRILSIITPVALDHTHLLGDNLGDIAAEKAGVIQQGTPVVLAPQQPEARHVIEKTAQTLQAPLIWAPQARVENGAPTLESRSKRGEFVGPAYQAMNINTAGCAIDALQNQGLAVSQEHLVKALKSWDWPGRFQTVSTSVGQTEVLVTLDGAHNPHAQEALMRALAQEQAAPLHVVFSAVHTKDAAQMLEILSSHAKSIHLTPSSVGKSLTQAAFETLAPGVPSYECASLALQNAQALAAHDGGRVLVTGSLFLVADVIHLLSGERRDMAIAS